MSEYQYYEFRAIDRRLTAGEMAKLRSFSSRARITPTSFVNEYEWGSFKGDEDAWMDRYFDAFLYFANWGTRILMLRVSSHLLGRAAADPYCIGESASAREHKGKTILSFVSEQEEDEWPEEKDALSALALIRTQIGRGDLRSLYVGWLLAVQAGEVDDDDIEPPVPPGLNDLDGPLNRLVDFLRIDLDLLEAAAAASPAMQEESLSPEMIRKWIAGQTVAQKDDYLERFIAAEDPALAAELQRLAGNRHDTASPSRIPRTAGALLAAAQKAADDRRSAALEQARIEKSRREHEAALARAKYLAELTQEEAAAWDEVDELIAIRQPTAYDNAVSLLIDLRDVAVAQGAEKEFMSRIAILRQAHARKSALLSRFQKAGLR